jgi:nicotinamide riboside transporter PnuC
MRWIVNYAARVNLNLVVAADFKMACYFPWFSTMSTKLGLCEYYITTITDSFGWISRVCALLVLLLFLF